MLAAFGLQLATIYRPLLNTLFKTQPLTATGLTGIVFAAVETEKWFGRRSRLS